MSDSHIGDILAKAVTRPSSETNSRPRRFQQNWIPLEKQQSVNRSTTIPSSR
jgi:hypothetical protein